MMIIYSYNYVLCLYNFIECMSVCLPFVEHADSFSEPAGWAYAMQTLEFSSRIPIDLYNTLDHSIKLYTTL